MAASGQPIHILVVDDEPAHATSLGRILERAGYRASVAGNADDALAVLRKDAVHVLLTDLVMPRTDGLELMRVANTVQPETDVILMTAYGTVENAVEAMREGAYDFITKPIKRGQVLASVQRAVERQKLIDENRALRAELAAAQKASELVGTSDEMRRFLATIRQVSSSTATILLAGESGTGKELTARAIHRFSARSEGPFVAVNCAALPQSILEAELFGAERGAFTGATQRRIGRFERAHGGTLLLDEVGDIPPAMQVKLLRVLQEGEIERLGGGDPIPVDVRVVAATNVDLKSLVDEGRFREDLFYRLHVISLRLPALRERRGDVPLLAMHFLKKYAEQHHKAVRSIETEALNALCAFPFPGNVRELENAIERAVVLSKGDVLTLDDLPDGMRDSQLEPPSSTSTIIPFRVGMSLEAIENVAIEQTLRHTDGDKVLAAKLLGMSLRTLYRRLEDRADSDAQLDDAAD